MSALITTLGIDRLSVEDRLQLVQEIWESLGPDVDRQPLTENQMVELNRRIAVLDANPEAVTPWETIEARAMKRLGL
jgi:putative addiction module component (TIGR02574 family)